MLTDLSKIRTDFEIDFGVDFRVDFKVNVSLFVLHCPKSHFYKFLVENKKSHIQQAQIETVFIKLIA